jgi:hypothetical protein
LLYPNATPGSFEFQRSLSPLPNDTRHPMLLQRDIAAGYSQPAIIDFKLGDRSWVIGADPKTASRRAAKMAGGICPKLFFRIRAAIWRGKSDQFERISGTSVSFVARTFGNTCTMEQLNSLFVDFFRFPQMIPLFVEKLKRLKIALCDLRNAFDTRFYSSSVVIVYDNANPSKCDLRMLDFEKSYVHAAKIAQKFGEPIENCEDHVIEGIENLKTLLGRLV